MFNTTGLCVSLPLYDGEKQRKSLFIVKVITLVPAQYVHKESPRYPFTIFCWNDRAIFTFKNKHKVW